MKEITFAAFLLVLNQSLAFDISVEFPPADDIEGEYALVPDQNGSFYKVKVEEALNEAMPFFNVAKGTVFELYTPLNPDEPEVIDPFDVDTLKESSFNPNLPTRIAIHGWNGRGSLTDHFKDAYFEKANISVNFICVDWGDGSNTVNYIAASRRVQLVGYHVGFLVDFLVIEGKLNLADLTIIGHSLGAHVSGFAGKSVTTGRVSKIVGLDPALPLYGGMGPVDRLDATDADYVEIIHTNAGYLGFSKPIGHASFYPNGGSTQPGCGWDMLNICAHRRAYLYYTESIHSDVNFYAYKCKTLERLRKGECSVENGFYKMAGEPGNAKLNGVYYLTTNSEPVFARGVPKRVRH